MQGVSQQVRLRLESPEETEAICLWETEATYSLEDEAKAGLEENI